ncbi:hypothetical protein L1049_008323 [Liquidambar formosana]|uniref:Uncharacterized protein n=1 Tax=Liquidambar formosana TaxID=63359 RepID=A0AAP0S433_LIQFO
MGEYKDYSAEKAKEGKEATTGKFSELKDTAVDAARRAMEFFSGKKEEAKEKTSETGEAAKEKLSETEEEARRKMEEMKLKGEEYKMKLVRRPRKPKKLKQKGRGSAAKSNIFSSLGSVTEAIKGKLTHPTDVVEETRAAREHNGTGRKDGEKVTLDVEETPLEPWRLL